MRTGRRAPGGVATELLARSVGHRAGSLGPRAPIRSPVLGQHGGEAQRGVPALQGGAGSRAGGGPLRREARRLRQGLLLLWPVLQSRAGLRRAAGGGRSVKAAVGQVAGGQRAEGPGQLEAGLQGLV